MSWGKQLSKKNFRFIYTLSIDTFIYVVWRQTRRSKPVRAGIVVTSPQMTFTPHVALAVQIWWQRPDGSRRSSIT